MPGSGTPTIIFALFLFLVRGVSGQSSGSLQPLWDRPMNSVRSVALSQTGQCAVVATLERISLLNRSGKEIWHWEYRRGNRFMIASRVAVSPGCDWIAATGGASYRYTWIAQRNGRLIPLRTRATPVSIAVSHHGNMLAIGTGGGDVLLFNSDGTMRWQRILTHCCVQSLTFSEDDQAIVSMDGGVVSIDGRTISLNQLSVSGLRASKDLKAFVGWYEPNHGRGYCWILSVDSSGKELWRKNAPYDPASIISPAGDVVVAPVKDKQDNSEAAAQCDSDSPSPLRLLSRSGDVLETFSAMARPLMFGPDGRWFLVRTDDFEAWDLRGRVLWSIPAFSQNLDWITTTEDLRSIVEWSEDRIALFAPPM